MSDSKNKIIKLTKDLLKVSELKKELALQIKDAWQQEMRAQQLQNIQLQQHLDAISEYLDEHGDLFLRKEDGDLMRDLAGLPIPIRLPNSEKEMNSRKSAYQIIQSLNLLVDRLVEFVDKDEAKNDPKVIDASKFEHLFETATPRKSEDGEE